MRALALAVVPMVLVSCGGRTGPKIQNEKKTIPVHGEVYLDGQPAQGVKVTLNLKGSQSATGSAGEVGEDGTFKIHTYGADDGAPAGDYVLTFTYRDPKGPLVLSFDTEEPPDDLKGKYADPKTSKYTVSVTEDATDVEVPRIDLNK